MTERKSSFSAPKGTRDVLPPESWEWQGLIRSALDSFALAGYEPIETPIFEHTEVFERGVGESSEVVGKQMYTFTDQGGRSLTLRPEGTAPVVRAVLEHGLHRGRLPIKLAYAGSMFRQERPQKGRYRQFVQVGIEGIGSDDPRLDAEVIELGRRWLGAVGVEAILRLNSIGHLDPSCRGGYLERLVSWLRDNQENLAPADRHRIEVNPLRTFDSKEAATVEVMRKAPLIVDHLCDACRKHFEEVTLLLDDLSVSYQLDATLVRGLDYYTRTAFEFISGELGSQNAVGGGGRYDGLSEALGGPPLPGIGFALGVDRALIARSEGSAGRSIGPVDVFVVAVGEAAEREALKIVTRLRAAGTGADCDLLGRTMKGQMTQADRSGARWAIILGDEEMTSRSATVKDLSTGEQRSVALDEIEQSFSS